MYFYKLMHAVKKINSNLFLLGIILAVFVFSTPQKAHAQWIVLDPANLAVNTVTSVATGITAGATTLSAAADSAETWGKEFVGDGIANFIAKTIIKQLTAQTVNWINTGFKGNPAFVTDPGQFFTNIADKTASDFIQGAGLNALCTPFRAEIRLALTKNYLNDQNNYSCTIDKIVANYDAFTKDFSQGGWEGWFSMTQNSQNNPYGAYLGARDELSINIAGKQLAKATELQQGSGFLSSKRCETWSAPVRPTEISCDENPAACICVSGVCTPNLDYVQVDSGSNNPDEETVGDVDFTGRVCTSVKNVTPGSVINDQLTKALGSSWEGLEAADEINEIVSALMTQMITKVVGSVSGGLRGLSHKSTTDPSPRTLLEQIVDSAATSSPESKDFNNGVNKGLPIDLGGTGTSLPNPDLTTPPPAPIDCAQFPSYTGCQQGTPVL